MFRRLAIVLVVAFVLAPTHDVKAAGLSHHYVVFVDGNDSTSTITSFLNGDFGPIEQSLIARGFSKSNFVYFSYRATRASGPSGYCASGWGGITACTPSGNLVSPGLSPVYTSDDTHIDLTRQATVLDWLLGQIVRVDPAASIDIVTFSLGGIIASYWGGALSTTSQYGASVHSVVLIESPVGGIPLASFILGNQCTLFVCVALHLGLDLKYGDTVVAQLQRPPYAPGISVPSIVPILRHVTDHFAVTSIQSTADYVVSGSGLPMCVPVDIGSLFTCSWWQSSLSVPLGIGSQEWGTSVQTLHFDRALGQPMPVTGVLPLVTALFSVVSTNHGTVLTDPLTSAWVTAAILPNGTP